MNIGANRNLVGIITAFSTLNKTTAATISGGGQVLEVTGRPRPLRCRRSGTPDAAQDQKGLKPAEDMGDNGRTAAADVLGHRQASAIYLGITGGATQLQRGFSQLI